MTGLADPWIPGRKRRPARASGLLVVRWIDPHMSSTRYTTGIRFIVATAIVCGISVTQAASSRQAVAPDGPRVIEVVARRYAFEPAEIEVAEGETVRLMVRSADGPHGIEIKQFKVKKEIPRGAAPIAIEFTAATPGRFPVLCSEYCGDGHGDMKGALVVTAGTGP
jgi:cytochrome c oxidase subunit II